MSDIWKIVVKQKFFRQDNAKDFKVEHWQRHTFSKKSWKDIFDHKSQNVERSAKSKCQLRVQKNLLSNPFQDVGQICFMCLLKQFPSYH